MVAFILGGSTHTTYCKTLQNALGMTTVNAHAFLNAIAMVTGNGENDGGAGLVEASGDHG